MLTKLIDEAFDFLSIYDVPYAHVQLYGFKAEKFKIRGDYNEYEKNMKTAIDVGIEKQQYSLVAELSYELGRLIIMRIALINYLRSILKFQLKIKWIKTGFQ